MLIMRIKEILEATGDVQVVVAEEVAHSAETTRREASRLAALGLDGVILHAFIAAIPANEIIVPTILMGYLAAGQMTELDDLGQLHQLLHANGWGLSTAISLMLFSVLHYPCSTTTWTIWKETRSVKWTVVSNLLPLAMAVAVCGVVNQLLQRVL